MIFVGPPGLQNHVAARRASIHPQEPPVHTRQHRQNTRRHQKKHGKRNRQPPSPDHHMENRMANSKKAAAPDQNHSPHTRMTNLPHPASKAKTRRTSSLSLGTIYPGLSLAAGLNPALVPALTMIESPRAGGSSIKWSWCWMRKTRTSCDSACSWGCISWAGCDMIPGRKITARSGCEGRV